jgi:hypothetical protein
VAIIFLYSLFYHGTVDLYQRESPTHVNQRIFRYSLVSSSLMFISLVLALLLLLGFTVLRPRSILD